MCDTFVKIPASNAEWRQKILKINSIKNYIFPFVYAWGGFHIYGLSKLKHFCSFKGKNTMPSLDLLGYIKLFYATTGAPDSSHHVSYTSQLLKEI